MPLSSGPTFDVVLANPPFSLRWEPCKAMGEDVRIKSHGVAPTSAGASCSSVAPLAGCAGFG